MINKDDINIAYEKFHLDNGMKCVLYNRQEIHSVTVRLNVNVGSLDETKETNGLSHFIEHVVHDGTEDFDTWDKVEDFKNKYSASTNAYTSLDHTQYYGTFPYQYLKEAIYFFSQVATKPLFSNEDVEKERTIIIDELKSYEDEIDFKIIQGIKESRFSNTSTPFSYDIIGTRKLLEYYSVDSLKEYWQKYYVPENMEIYILGNFSVDEAKKLLNIYFGDMEKRESPARNFKIDYPDYSAFKIKAKQKLDLDKYYLTFTFPGFDFKSVNLEERGKINFVKTMTASSSFMHSVLWKKLRQELGMVYGVYAWDYDMYSKNILGVGTSFEKKHLETVIKEYYDGINKIKSGDISDSVFKSKKRKILDTQLMQLDKPEQALAWISNYEDEIEEHGVGMMIAEYLEYVEKLKFEEIIEIANKVYNWDDVNINLVSQDNAEEVEKEVRKIWDEVTNLP